MARHRKFKLSSWRKLACLPSDLMCPWECLWQISPISFLTYKRSPEQPLSTTKGDIRDGSRARTAS